MSENYKEVGYTQFGDVKIPIYRDQSPAINYGQSVDRYTYDEVKALRFMVREEFLDEMEERFGVRDEFNLSERTVEDRLKTYIMAGLKL